MAVDDNDLPTRLLSKLRIAIPGYSLLRELDRGGQAVVYKAIAKVDGGTVAIKVLHNGPFADASARQRLEREIIALRSLKHPNIVRILGNGQSPDGHDFIVMEYIKGRPLGDFIGARQNGPVPDDYDKFLLALFRKICAAMAEAHRAGITHRDLSPSNILIDGDDEPHIIDFGLSRTAFDHFFAAGRREISQSGQFMGKLEYASPEQVRGNKGAADIRTDVYALGVILYRIVTGGRFPYAVDGTLDEILNSIIHSCPTPPSSILQFSEIDPGNRPIRRPTKLSPVDPVLEAIVLRALEKEPADRYASAGELEQELGRYLANEPTLARPKRPHYRISRRTWLAAASFGVVACGAAIVGRNRASRRSPLATTASPEAVDVPPVAPPPPLPRITFGTPEIHGGHWSVEGDDLIQTDLAEPNATIAFGDPGWSNYDLSFKVTEMSVSETNGFKAQFHWTDPENFYSLALGNSSDSSFELSRCAAGGQQRDPSMHRTGKIEFGRVYEVRIEVRGSKYRCFLDGEELFHKHDGVFRNGRIGLATSHAAARFSNIRVASADGKILWNGPPASVQRLVDVQARVRGLLEKKYRGQRDNGEIMG